MFNFRLPVWSTIENNFDFLLNYIFQGLSAIIPSTGLTGFHTFYFSPIVAIGLQIDYLRYRLDKLSSTEDFSSLKDIIKEHSEIIR